MKLRIKNNRPADYGVEQVGGGYTFIPPGKTRVVDAANPSAIYAKEFLVVEAEDSEVTTPPKSLSAKVRGDGTGKALPPASDEKREAPPILDVDEALSAEVVTEQPSLRKAALDHDGKAGPGGSVKGFHSTAAKGARRRRKAPSK